MTGYSKTLSLNLAAAVTNGIAQSQTLSAAGNFNLNGSLVTAGVATLDSNGNARRVLFTLAADETGHNATIVGTGWNGKAQSEVIALTTVTAVSVKDYKTVTQVSLDAIATGAIQIGTNGIASTAPWIVDPYTTAGNIGCGLDVTGTINVTIQLSLNNLEPAWDINNASPQPMWFDSANFASKSSDTGGVITEPMRMIRMLQNSFSTGGSAIAHLLQPMGGKST